MVCSSNISDCALLEHARNFPWLFSNTYNVESVVTYLKKRTLEPFKEKKVNPLEKNQSIDFSDEAGFLINFLRDAGTVRLTLKCAWAGSEFMALNLFEEISKRADLSIEDFMAAYRKQEVIELLKYGTKILNCTVAQRKKNYLYIIRDCRKSFFSGSIAQKMKENELSLDFDENYIVGKTANSGFVKGVVRIVANEDICSLSEAIDSFKQGEILVTTMTHPNMMLLAEKALGIITDEGGITSHAAILARELNIPCLVGTKFASKVLKTGDLVKLNASNGFAEKLKSDLK